MARRGSEVHYRFSYDLAKSGAIATFTSRPDRARTTRSCCWLLESPAGFGNGGSTL